MRPSSDNSVSKPMQRIDGIDFWRGVVLCTIFINHIPGNLFEIVTQKNYGFSDSAEAFVFLSGLSLALAYAPRFARGQAGSVVGAMARRAVKLYGLHIALSLGGLAVFVVGAAATNNPALLEMHGRDLFVEEPRTALIGLMSLGHQLGYFNILPLYVLLLAPAALLLWIGTRRPWLMLAISLVVYLAARAANLDIPTWPMKGSWFFDPFAWQLMMALGLCAGLSLGRQVPRTPWLIGLAIAVVLASAFMVSNGFGFVAGLEPWAQQWADLNKTMLGFGRIIHFGAVAYLIAALSLTNFFRDMKMFGAFCRLGRNSLSIFALLSLLAALGQVLTSTFGHSLGLDSALIVGGVAALLKAATLMEARRPTVAPIEAPAAAT